jgi:uncharacterized protein YkwD
MPGTPPLGPAALPRALILLLLVLVAVAATLAVGPARAAAAACPGAAQPLGAASAAATEGAVLCLVNDERAARGLAAVRRDGALEAVAQRHAADMVARGYFAHVSPSGGTVDKRARRAGYLTAPCWALGEDLARAPAAVASGEAVVAAWMASPGHRSVILDSDFSEGGIGLVPRAPGGDGDGATFVLELGAMVPCAGAAPRARVRAS